MTHRDLVSSTADHRLHDQLLIVRSAAGDLHASEVAVAEELMARCSECAALADDLRSIALATATVQAPSRTRDFRLTREQATALRGSPWARLLRWLASPRGAVLQPLASAAVAIGLVLVVVGNGFPGQGTAPNSDQAPLLTYEASPSPDDIDRETAAAGATEGAPVPGAPETPPAEMSEATPGPDATFDVVGAQGTADATAGAATGIPADEPPAGEHIDTARPSPAQATGPPEFSAPETSMAPWATLPTLQRTDSSPAAGGTTGDRDRTAAGGAPSPSPSEDEGRIPSAARTPAPTAAPVLASDDAQPVRLSGLGQAIVLLGAGLAAIGAVLLALRLLARRDVTLR